ncbi:MAG: hypothetical protein IJ744_00875 [Lachnospiraceae bacterium]|nr:hypothetical protein [Lachnospiraceae bacterium]
MLITYASERVEKYFVDYKLMQRKLPADWVRNIKKHIDRLRAAECFEDFLKLGLGKPERLTGYTGRYSLHVSANARLIIELVIEEQDEKCKIIEIEGVSDYHGDKENWYLP